MWLGKTFGSREIFLAAPSWQVRNHRLTAQLLTGEALTDFP